MEFEIRDKQQTTRSRRLIAVGLAILLSFVMGSVLTVYPREHPRGLLGLVADMPGLPEQYNTPHSDELIRPPENPDLLVASRSEIEIVSVRGDVWELSYVAVPGTIDYWENGQKPAGFLARDKKSGDLFLATGDGHIFEFDPQEKTFSELETDLKSVLDQEVIEPGKFSVKGFEVDSGVFFVSASATDDRHSRPCWSTSVFSAEQNRSNTLEFVDFWKPAVCVSFDEFPELNPHQAGGALLSQDGALLVATGEYRARPFAQDPASGLGALVSVLKANPLNSKVLGYGLRNPQSLVAIDDGGFYVTDQGPRGGDEINFVSADSLRNGEPQNFGWPVASYGIHYDGTFKADAPLLRSHAKYGFLEPAYFFSASIGISSISRFGNSGFIAGGMGNVEDAIEGDTSLLIFDEPAEGNLELKDRIEIGERVRSIVPYSESCFWLVLDSGELGELCQNSA